MAEGIDPDLKSNSGLASGSGDVNETWSMTMAESFHGKHAWKICNFDVVSAQYQSGKYIQSPTFSFDVLKDGKVQALHFCIEVYPNGVNTNFDDLVSVYLRSLNENELWLEYTFSLLYNENRSSRPKAIAKFGKQGTHVTPENFARLLMFYGTSTDKALIIECSLAVHLGYHNFSREKSITIPKCLSLTEKMKNLFDEDPDNLPFPDIVLVCGKDTYPCHKFILSAGSPVFKAMFSHPMKELSEGKVEMPYEEPCVMKNFLKFFYSDSVEHIQSYEDAMMILPLADKYCVEKLKVSCETIICGEISLQNVFQTLKMAEKINATILLPGALDYVTWNLEKLISTPELREITTNSPNLFREISTNCPNYFVEILKKNSFPKKL